MSDSAAKCPGVRVRNWPWVARESFVVLGHLGRRGRVAEGCLGVYCGSKHETAWEIQDGPALIARVEHVFGVSEPPSVFVSCALLGDLGELREDVAIFVEVFAALGDPRPANRATPVALRRSAGGAADVAAHATHRLFPKTRQYPHPIGCEQSGE